MLQIEKKLRKRQTDINTRNNLTDMRFKVVTT